MVWVGLCHHCAISLLSKITPKNVYCLSKLIKTLQVWPLTGVSASKVQAFHMKFVSTEALNWSSLPHFGHYSAARLRFLDVIPSEKVCSLWLMAALEPYYFEPNMAQTTEVDKNMENIDSAGLGKDAKIICRFSYSQNSHQLRVGRNDVTNTVWLSKYFQNGGLRGLFREEFLWDNELFRG